MPVNTKRAGLGGLFGGLAEGIWKGLATIETQKRTKVLEDEEARRKTESEALVQSEKDKLIAKQQADNLAILKERTELQRAKNAEMEAKLKNFEFLNKVLPDTITPLQFEKMKKDGAEDEFDPSMFYTPDTDEKTGVVKTLSRSDPDAVKKRLDAAHTQLKIKNEEAEKAIKALELQIAKKKLEGGEIPKSMAEAMVDTVYKDPKFKTASPEMQKQMIADAAWKLPTPSTVMKPGGTNIKNIQAEMQSMAENVSFIKDIKDNFNKEFFTYKGKGKKWVLDKLVKGEVEISPESTKFIQQGRSLANAAERMYLKFVHDQSGAAYSIKEMDRMKNAFMNMDMNSIEFEQSYNDYIRYYQKAYRLKDYFLKRGVPEEEVGKEIDNLLFLSEDPTLSVESRTMRGNELRKQYVEKNKGKDLTEKDIMNYVDDILTSEGRF